MAEPRTHLVIPDCQVQAGDYISDHLGWIGQFWLDHRNEITDVVCIGDFADMESLSSHESRGSIAFEGRRYLADVEAARNAMQLLLAPITAWNAQKAKWRKQQYEPAMHLTIGNHEHRITRAVESMAELEGVIGFSDLGYADAGWTVHDFLEVVNLDGVNYSHYFYNTGNGRSLTGTIDNRLKTIGASFVQGHQQQLAWGMRYVLGRSAPIMGLIAGACYLGRSPAAYRGPQAEEWRGVVLLRDVADGAYDLQTVSLDSLCRKYEGVTLDKFTSRIF
jgi:hypothetical protein